MGCTSSKRIDHAVDVYCPAPSSVSVFDISSIEEPWMKLDMSMDDHHQQKPTYVPPRILEKLNAIEDDPRTWDEVSKALEDLKPTLNNPPTSNPIPTKKKPVQPQPLPEDSAPPKKAPRRKSFSFHTLEELDAKLSTKPDEFKKTDIQPIEPKKSESVKTERKKSEKTNTETRTGFVAVSTDSEGYKPVRENIFIVRDRLEREKEGKTPIFVKRDPLSDFPEKCPPGGSNSVVIYTTSLGGVRRTFEDCNQMRSILETHQLVFEERDVSLHGEYLKELKALLGDGVSVPRMFVKGRYLGGVEEVVGLNETGRLGRLMRCVGVERGIGRQDCEGCGGARFVPCLECGGSCKVLAGEKKEKCNECNENGLMLCPACGC